MDREGLAFRDRDFSAIEVSFLSHGESSSDRRHIVRRALLRIGFGFITFSVLGIYSLTFALDESIVKIQGRVMELDLQKNMMIVNERTFFWGPHTSICDENGSPVAADRLKTKIWVYIEGSSRNSNKKLVADKIFLIPRYIHGKEKHLYPFIQ